MSQHIISYNWQNTTALPNNMLVEQVCRGRTDMQCRVQGVGVVVFASENYTCIYMSLNIKQHKNFLYDIWFVEKA